MSTDKPLVSVVIATRGRPATLKRLLCAVRDQDLDDLEVLVVDDDSPAEIVNEYDSVWRDLDPRFVLHMLKRGSDHKGGPSATRNAGIQRAKGTFVAFCDDDDMWVRSDHLSVATATLSTHSADVFFGNMRTIHSGKISNYQMRPSV
jgi:glycosyltransferase involved in cell wall biosynthesis